MFEDLSAIEIILAVVVAVQNMYLLLKKWFKKDK